jgi:hypothetical protein
MLSTTDSSLIFDFEKNVNLQNWRVVDDVVMGGRSSGNFAISNDGHGVFSGEVSLKTTAVSRLYGTVSRRKSQLKSIPKLSLRSKATERITNLELKQSLTIIIRTSLLSKLRENGRK